MANPHTGERSFEVGGATYTLRFTVNALCELEDAVGSSVSELGAALADPTRARVKLMRALLWAGLRDRHPQLTIEDAGALLDDGGAQRIMPLVAEAFSLAFPAPEKKTPRPR